MFRALTRYWWLPLANGICVALLGAFAFIAPAAVLIVVLVCCGLYLLIDGVNSVSLAMAMRHTRSRLTWQLLAGGVISLLAGVLTLAWPGAASIALVLIVSIWAIAHGLAEFIAATHLRKYIHGEWILYAIGVTSILFGIALLLNPETGILLLAWMLGAFAWIRAALLCALAFELRGIRRNHSAAHHPPLAPIGR
jgi:uncharacterized membrane protein HdeD (DUF308 family)